MDYSRDPPIEPRSALQALSNLGAHVDNINETASKILINRRSFYDHLVRLITPYKLPDDIDKLSANFQYLIDWDCGGLGFLYDVDMVPLEGWRIENTIERVRKANPGILETNEAQLLKPLIYLSYVLIRGAISPPKRLKKTRMITAISKLADDMTALGERVRPFIRDTKYQRALHAITRLRRAEDSWRVSLGS